MSNLYQFYEVVTIDSPLDEHKEINKNRGVILGMAFDDSDETWGYAVSIESTSICWSIEEKYLKPTGEFKKREDIY